MDHEGRYILLEILDKKMNNVLNKPYFLHSWILVFHIYFPSTVSCCCFISKVYIDCHVRPRGIKDLSVTRSINGELFCHSSLCLAIDMSWFSDVAPRAYTLNLSENDLLREAF